MNTLKLRFDPRLWLILNHISLLVSGIIFFNFQRTLPQIFWTVGGAVFSDIFLRYLFKKQELCFRNLFSPVITGLSVVLLLNTYSLSVYIFAVITSIASKYILNLNQKHFFNPSLFGIVAAYCWFDFGEFIIQYDQFMGIGYCAFQLCIVGFITLYFAKRITMPVFYYFTLISGAFAIQFFLHNEIDFLQLIGPEISASGILFAFFMMTDPVTSPPRWTKQAVFSIICALLSLVFTINQIPHSNFISLFFLNSIYMLFFWKKTFKIFHLVGKQGLLFRS